MVTPFAGVWIEMAIVLILAQRSFRHSLRGSVDWNTKASNHTLILFSSLPSRECGLKSDIWTAYRVDICHSLRGSVDWNLPRKIAIAGFFCHSLRGSVDWNNFSTHYFTQSFSHSLRGSVDWNNILNTVIVLVLSVTPFAGVWIEMLSSRLPPNVRYCHSLRGSVDWNS